MRASISQDNNCVRILNKTNLTDTEITTQISIHILDEITILPPPIDWFIHHIKSSVSTSSLYTALLDGTAITVSDGSFFPLDKVGDNSYT